VNVNAYHQPGVEAGKKAAANVLAIQTQVMALLKKEIAPIALTDLAAKAQMPDQIEAIYKILRHLDANDRGVVLSGDLAQPRSLKVLLK
jgi:glucose-6-phosphate isomerase